jgi:hypothetical protein
MKRSFCGKQKQCSRENGGTSKHTCIGASLLFIVLGVSSLLLGFSGDGCLHDVRSSQSLKLGLSALDFDLLSKLFITSFCGTGCFNLGNVDIPIESGLAGCEGGFGFSLLAVSLSLLNGSLCVDLGNFTILLTLAGSFTDITLSLSFSNINTSLVDSTFMCLARERLEVA